MVYARKSPYAGALHYAPRAALGAETLAALRRALLSAGLISEAENPAVVVDWYYEARGPAGDLLQRYVVLYRDGGDAGRPACAFYRKDVNRRENRVEEFIHLPGPEDQPRLCAAWQWVNDPGGESLRMLTEYADGVALNAAPGAWQPLGPGGAP